jgi:hypothetical protein
MRDFGTVFDIKDGPRQAEYALDALLNSKTAHALFTCGHGMDETWFHTLTRLDPRDPDNPDRIYLLHAMRYEGDDGHMFAASRLLYTAPPNTPDKAITFLDSICDYTLYDDGIDDRDMGPGYLRDRLDENGWSILTSYMRGFCGPDVRLECRINNCPNESGEDMRALKASAASIMQACMEANVTGRTQWGVAYPWEQVRLTELHLFCQ